MNNLLGVLIGAGLDRRDGDSGIKGALEGYVAEAVIKTVAPIAVTFAIGWGVQFLARRAMHALTGDPALQPDAPRNG